MGARFDNQTVTSQRHQAWILEQCTELFDASRLRVQLNKVLALEEAAGAHRLIEAGGMAGKLVLAIG
jgi:NADPH2:quinone reductase